MCKPEVAGVTHMGWAYPRAEHTRRDAVGVCLGPYPKAVSGARAAGPPDPWATPVFLPGYRGFRRKFNDNNPVSVGGMDSRRP